MTNSFSFKFSHVLQKLKQPKIYGNRLQKAGCLRNYHVQLCRTFDAGSNFTTKSNHRGSDYYKRRKIQDEQVGYSILPDLRQFPKKNICTNIYVRYN